MYSSNVDKILGRLVSAILAGYFFVFCGCGSELAVGYGTIRRETRGSDACELSRLFRLFILSPNGRQPMVFRMLGTACSLDE
jgi:hypothetical protein